MKQFANNISRLQKTQHLSISSLARTLNVSRRTVDRILGRDIEVVSGNHYVPSPETIEKVADAFGVDRTDVTKRLPRFVIDSVNPA